MKILHISISDSNGGAAIAAKRLHSLMNEDASICSKMLVLVKSTDDNSIFYLDRILFFKGRVANFINNIIGKLKKQPGLFSFPFLGNDISKSIFVREADVIYIHWINNGMVSWSAIHDICSLKKPVFFFVHDMWFFTGGCHQSNGCIQYENYCLDCYFFNRVLIKNLVYKNFKNKKNTYRSFSNIKLISPSTDFYRKAISSKIIDSSKVIFIPNILDTDRFVPTKYFEKSGTIKVLYGAMGGKANPYKGWDDFVYFAGEVSKKYRASLEIHLFGYDFLSNEIESLPFRFVSHGIITEERHMIRMYQKADVFVFPSSQESFGQTLIEAMSCGLIPIAYNVGIAPDIILNGQNGYLVEKGDRIGLVNAFDLVLNSNINHIKSNVRRSIEENFSKEIIMKKHLSLIRSALWK